MKQYYITSLQLSADSPDDCVLDPSDPVHALKATQYLDGLGGDSYLQQIATSNADSSAATVPVNKAQIMRENNIKPGTQAWFKLWYGQAQ